MNDVQEMEHSITWRSLGRYRVSSEVFLDLIFTDRCNLACPFCIARTPRYAQPDFEAWRGALTQALKLFPVRSLIVLGGEATVDPLFFERLDAIRGLLPGSGVESVILTTNGVRLRDEAFLERLCQSCVSAVNLSYMNEEEPVNDALMGGRTLRRGEIIRIHERLAACGKTLRLNVNCFRGNCGTPEEMERYVRRFAGCCEAIKFTPLMKTDMFGTVEDVTAWARAHAYTNEEIAALFDAFSARGNLLRENIGVFGKVRYRELEVCGQRVLLKYAQLEERYDPACEIPTLKLYPNGNLSNEWDFTKNILAEFA